MSRTKARVARRNRRILLCGILLVALVIILALLVQKFGTNPNDPAGDHTLQQTDTTQTDTVTKTDTATKTDETSNVPSTDNTTNTQTTDTATQSATGTGKPNTKTDSDTPNQTVNTNEPTDSFDKDEWYMLLANRDNPVPEGYTFPQAKIYSGGTNWILDARCADDMKAMIAAAKEDGVSLLLCSTYRTVERQTNNFNKKVNEYINKGYSEAEAKEITATIIAIPGTSEHHTGLAADIVTPSYQRLNEGFAETEAFRWLYEHCAEYGFIMRYAKDKQDVTKIIYEPWHYRYVGKEAAQIIMSEGICLEEFLEKYGT